MFNPTVLVSMAVGITSLPFTHTFDIFSMKTGGNLVRTLYVITTHEQYLAYLAEDARPCSSHNSDDIMAFEA